MASVSERYARGGYIPGSGAPMMVSDDECFLNRKGECVRNDDRHGYEWSEVHAWGEQEPVAHIRGLCKHLPRHVVPVESGDRVVAHLCTICDAQLP